MQAYLARLNAKQGNPREIVGLFVAKDLRQLCNLVDECCNIDAVEVLKLGPGGIYWSSSVDFVVPHPEREDEDEAPAPLPGAASLTDWWFSAFFEENEDRWEQLEWPEMAEFA